MMSDRFYGDLALRASYLRKYDYTTLRQAGGGELIAVTELNKTLLYRTQIL